MKAFKNLKKNDKLFFLKLGKNWNNSFINIIHRFKDIKEIIVKEIVKYDDYITIIFNDDTYISVYNNPHNSNYSYVSNYVVDDNNNYIIVNGINSEIFANDEDGIYISTNINNINNIIKFILNIYIKKFKKDIYNIEQIILDCESIESKLEYNPE